ncbi:sirohydrochlorin ferrochelatase [Mumia flava]|uniref:Sirohydrochlorin ferrochelatase n=1 Tax=Mumia flava TaxID=1348852 RepID=A0A0B2BLB5_9ACTN|nr:sirohydrochlorin chelatase [Mumia flava]PJJ56239.1 sirohydrochlorin ferrochelatase [Mumia flava]
MTTLIACSHGTRSDAGQAAIRGLVAAVRHRLAPVDVAETFVDVQQPQVAEVVAATDGPAVVVPLLLSAGFHVHVDIAEAVAGREDVVVAPPLGPSPVLTEVLADRLVQAGLRDDDRVVLAASGSSDAGALRDTDSARNRLAALLGRPVGLGHVGGPGRPIDRVVSDLRASDPARRVVIASYLLAPGWFRDRLDETGADLVSAPLLGVEPPDPRLVSLVVDRFRTAENDRRVVA